MFKEARIKLTTWYLLIIMIVSLSFSGVIYTGINRELRRIEDFQRVRIQRVMGDVDAIAEARARIIVTLAFINLCILVFSGLGGYFLAGVTLDPIAEMVEKQKEFVSNASHELRTPLTALMTEIEVALRDKKITLPEAKRLLGSNLEEVKKMNDLSNYLLKLNKFQDGKSTTKFIKVDLKTVVINVMEKLDPIARSKNIKLVPKLAPFSVSGDEDTLAELVTILVENAIKYSPSGKVVDLIIKNRSLVVKDQGIGISKEDLPHIFERFYRADSSRNKAKSEGYGLGLSIAKSIVELHNASIKVESKVGVGSTFTIIF